MTTDKLQPDIHLFTDGACSGNPGPGGWAYILEHVPTGTVKELAGADRETTNNRMELTAVIEGLQALRRPCHVKLFTDSQYVGKGLSEWMPKWKANGWRRGNSATAKPVKNVELWKRLDELMRTHHVTFVWVAGHSGHEENERCDRLAVAAYQKYL
jgi:ribonuclease HI